MGRRRKVVSFDPSYAGICLMVHREKGDRKTIVPRAILCSLCVIANLAYPYIRRV